LMLGLSLERVRIDLLESKITKIVLFACVLIIVAHNFLDTNILASFALALGLEKYYVYLTPYDLGSRLLHNFYFAFICLAFYVFFINRCLYSCLERNYVAISFLIYLLIMFSPVFAFRQSIFWLPVVMYRMDYWRCFSYKPAKWISGLMLVPVFLFSLYGLTG
jgi:hypothetical protein